MMFIGRDLRLLTQDSGALAQLWLLPVLIFFIAGLFLPSGTLAPTTTTVLTLLTLLMVALQLAARLWHDDIQSGVLEQVLVSPRGLVELVTVRWGTLYVLACLPVIAVIMAAQRLWLGQAVTGAVIVAALLLAASTLALVLLVAALTTSLRNGAMLVALLLVPFLLPVFIAFAAVTAIPAALYLLAAAAVLAIPLCCLATAHVLRQQLCV